MYDSVIRPPESKLLPDYDTRYVNAIETQDQREDLMERIKRLAEQVTHDDYRITSGIPNRTYGTTLRLLNERIQEMPLPFDAGNIAGVVQDMREQLKNFSALAERVIDESPQIDTQRGQAHREFVTAQCDTVLRVLEKGIQQINNVPGSDTFRSKQEIDIAHNVRLAYEMTAGYSYAKDGQRIDTPVGRRVPLRRDNAAQTQR